MTDPAPQPICGWAVSEGLTPYEAAVRAMELRAPLIADGQSPELVWLLEHPPLLTAGTSARPGDILSPQRFPVHQTGRGGQVTYHGPGQRVAYVMLDVRRRFGGDVRRFVETLESWIIDALAALGVEGHLRDGAPGVYVRRAAGDGGGVAKIASLGIRIRRGISFHGVSLNVAPDLSHFEALVACGEPGLKATSLAALGFTASMRVVDNSLLGSFERNFGPASPAAPPNS